MDPINFYLNNLLGILSFQLLLFLFLIIFNFKHLTPITKKVNLKFWFLIIALVLTPHIFIDLQLVERYDDRGELWTLVTANEFSYGKTHFYTSFFGKIEPTPYPWGPIQPFIISIFFIILGRYPLLMFLLDILFSVFSIILIFLVFSLLFRDKSIAFITSLMLGMLMTIRFPWRSIYFFFILLSLYFMFIAWRKSKKSLYLLALIAILFTMEVRFEALSLLITFFIGLLIYRKNHNFREVMKEVLLPLIIFFSLFPIYFIKISTGAKHGTAMIISNFFLSPLNFFQEIYFSLTSEYPKIFISQFIWFWTHEPFLYLAPLILVGLSYGFKKFKKKTFILFSYFLFFVFGFYIYGNGYLDNYAFLTTLPALFFFGLGIKFIKDKCKKIKSDKLVLIISILLIFSLWNDIYSFSSFKFKSSNFIFFNFPFSPEAKEIKRVINENNLGYIITNDEKLEQKIEFLLLEDALQYKDIVTRYFIFYTNPNETELAYFFGFVTPSKQENEKRQMIRERIINQTLQIIEKNEKVQRELKNKIFKPKRSNYYIEDKCIEDQIDKLMFKSLNKIFNFKKLSKINCLEIYKINEKY
jgi:hypothetical protein